MDILGLIKLFKKTSMFFLRLQEQLITMRLSLFLNKHKKHLKSTVVITAEIETKKQQLNEELKLLLKKYKNNASLILDYIQEHQTKVYKLRNAKEILKKLGEEEGLLPAYSGLKALVINLVLFKKFTFKTESVFIIDEENIDIYYLIQQFHRWYFMYNGFSGFDEKSQNLLKAVNKGNEDNIIAKLKPQEFELLNDAIARDVESITFVEQYARETGGSKKALEKIKNGLGAKI